MKGRKKLERDARRAASDRLREENEERYAQLVAWERWRRGLLTIENQEVLFDADVS